MRVSQNASTLSPTSDAPGFDTFACLVRQPPERGLLPRPAFAEREIGMRSPAVAIDCFAAVQKSMVPPSGAELGLWLPSGE